MVSLAGHIVPESGHESASKSLYKQQYPATLLTLAGGLPIVWKSGEKWEEMGRTATPCHGAAAVTRREQRVSRGHQSHPRRQGACCHPDALPRAPGRPLRRAARGHGGPRLLPPHLSL